MNIIKRLKSLYFKLTNDIDEIIKFITWNLKYLDFVKNF